MKMDKQKLISDWMARPIQKGDSVRVSVPYVKMVSEKVKNRWVNTPTREVKTGTGKVIKICNDDRFGDIFQVQVDSWSMPSSPIGVPDGWHGPSGEYGEPWFIESWIEPNTDHLGADPFVEAPDIRFYNQDIESILGKACYSRYDETFDAPTYKTFKKDESKTYGGVNFNPYVMKLGPDGYTKVYYQRDLVWTVEQKQDLIQTIYDGGEIGKFVFRYRTFEHVEKQAESEGHGYDWDCVDGKQRFHAILEFLQNKYPDRDGNYWNDLSVHAQRKFMRYSKLSFGELAERTNDRETIMAFLHVNVKGTPVSAEHIEKVNSIYTKEELNNEIQL